MAIEDNTTSLNSVLAAVNALPSGGGSSEETWELLTTIDVSTADVFEVDFDAPVKKLAVKANSLTDTAGAQYSASTTVYRNVYFKVGGAWKYLKGVTLGACSHSWGFCHRIYLNAIDDVPSGIYYSGLSSGAENCKGFPLAWNSTWYMSGNIEGIKIELIFPSGTENTASGKIEVWGVKA